MLILLCPPETEIQAEDRWLGNLATSNLSEAGRAVARVFTQVKTPDRVYCGPGEHIREFAGYAVTTDGPVEILMAFTNRSMGSLTGRSYRETLAEFPRRNWLGWQRSFWTAPPDGESLFDISERVLDAFRNKILPIASAETVVIIAAPDVLRVLIAHLTHSDETEIPKIQIENSVPYVIHGDL